VGGRPLNEALDGMGTTRATEFLQSLKQSSGVTVAKRGEALELCVVRGDIRVTVTVPFNVREWFVDVVGPAMTAKIDDWCDYDGYDDSSAESLDSDMANDVMKFVDRLLKRELRIADGESLEWLVNNDWHRAVPLGDAV
jgi:hypothetical protein